MANTFKEMKKAIGVLDVEKRFCRDQSELDLINAKLIALTDIFDTAKEYVSHANHQAGSDVGDRLIYYLTEGNMNTKKVADYFKVSPATVASNIHYASKAYSTLLEGVETRLMKAEDLETVRVAYAEFLQIKKSVMNPYDLPEISLKKAQKRLGKSLPNIKSSPPYRHSK
ncbi:hypothetical protein [Paenibacillus sp. EPM92]|uniref:hypothetical protein n=1 Tax=Paenibacillus sp. EPM92 TaxID=1561195 RepID=UPI0019152363|nr:hypothetical protein [Paenibacillus sp. EPM92]